MVPMVHGWKATGRPFWPFSGRPGRPTARGSMIPEATSPVARGLARCCCCWGCCSDARTNVALLKFEAKFEAEEV